MTQTTVERSFIQLSIVDLHQTEKKKNLSQRFHVKASILHEVFLPLFTANEENLLSVHLIR